MNQETVQPQYVQPQLVVMPQTRSNGLGVLGFFIALIGLFIPTGVVSLLGLVLCLAAIGRSPRGFATMGVILGLLGFIFHLVLLLVAAALALVGVVVGGLALAVCFVLIQPEVVEVTADMVNVAIAVEDHQQRNDELPGGLDELDLSSAIKTDPWGVSYQLVSADIEHGFDVISAGPDGVFKTMDDIELNRLNEFWEKAAEDFGEKAEEFGEKMERLDGRRYHCRSVTASSDCSDDYKGDYEAEAVRELCKELSAELEEISAVIELQTEELVDSDEDED